MVEKIILELPDNVLKQAHSAADRTGRAVEDVLAEWVARGAERDVASLLKNGAEYPIYTPFGNEEAAKVLRDTLKAHQAKKGK